MSIRVRWGVCLLAVVVALVWQIVRVESDRRGPSVHHRAPAGELMSPRHATPCDTSYDPRFVCSVW